MALIILHIMAYANISQEYFLLARLDDGIIGSNPTRGMDVYVYVYSMFVFCVGRGLVMS
jgi:hypothetical protein